MMGMLDHTPRVAGFPGSTWLLSVKVPLKQLHFENPETVRCKVAGTMLEVHALGGGPLGPLDPHAARPVTTASIATAGCLRMSMRMLLQLRRVSSCPYSPVIERASGCCDACPRV